MTGDSSVGRVAAFCRRHAGALLALAAIVAVALNTTGLWATNTLPDPGWAVTAATSTSNLTDGQPVTVNIKANSNVSVNYAEIHQCRLDATYTQESDLRPPAGKCPPGPVSSSADWFWSRDVSSGLVTLARTDAGFNFSFRVGAGEIDWTANSGPVTLPCDPTHPCALVVEIQAGSGPVFVKVPLNFVEADALAACGSVSKAALATAASDELSDAWATWTRSYCAANPGGAPGRAAFTGEGPALAQFAAGTLDLAYTGVGFNDTAQVVPTGTSSRASVAIPIALNAAVLAAGGGYFPKVNGVPVFDKSPYPPFEMSAAETAAIIGGGYAWFGDLNNPYLASATARNPVLAGVAHGSDAPNTLVPSQALTSSWVMTDYLATLAQKDFIDPAIPPPNQRSATASLATATPDYSAVTTYTGRPTLYKYAFKAPFSTDNGPMWVMTDRATANALGLVVDGLENANHDFVPPTTATMDAAVASMKTDAQGILVPDPTMTTPVSASSTLTAADAVTPYPLTYVEYALVPAEPLYDPDTCALRTDSQAILTKWLEYITGPGQQLLPAGLEPLQSSLAKQAATAIAKVGQSPITGTCAGKTSAPTGGSSGPGSGGTGAAPSGNIPASNFASSVPAALPVANTTPTTTTPKQAEQAVAVPAFAGHVLPDSTGGIVALVGIVLVTSLGVFITSRQGLGGGAPVARGAAGQFEPAAQRNLLHVVLLWGAVAVVATGLVAYQLGPFFEAQDQHELLAQYRSTLKQAAFASQGLPRGSTASSTPPDAGSPVGVLEIGRLKTQQVVLEGISTSETTRGPGHVPGTAGLGQPGNSVVVARRNAFGGPFADLARLRRNDRIVVTTTEGSAVYSVRTVHSQEIVDGQPGKGNEISRDSLYGASKDDRLTLVTSATSQPWNSAKATVVTAKMVGLPFAPQVQGARTTSETSVGGDSGAWPSVVLASGAYVAVIAASVVAYRRLRFRLAYLLTIMPLVAVTVVLGQNVMRLFPSWT